MLGAISAAAGAQSGHLAGRGVVPAGQEHHGDDDDEHEVAHLQEAVRAQAALANSPRSTRCTCMRTCSIGIPTAPV